MSAKRALVTGASRGIGRAIAIRLAQAGWNVAIHYVNQGRDAEATKNELGAQFSGMYQADLADSSASSKLFDEALADGPIHALVNNAGVYLPQNFVTAGDAAFKATWHKTFAINFEAPMLLTRSAAKYYVKNGGGKILNVCSRVGFKGEGGAAVYAASKAALINLTRSLAVELADKNIQLYGIAPGWVDTAMAREGMTEKLPEILETIPVGRMASPADCGAVAAFLLSEEAAYLSGEVIDINGASYFH
ncbi:MAG: SDR family oxidoreductase [Fimbriimonadaceae bacterium]|nr:SDR family oxidoreductase [Fimbriimonadaceae bacterium]